MYFCNWRNIGKGRKHDMGLHFIKGMDLRLLEQLVAKLPGTRLAVVSQVNEDLEPVSDNVDGGATYPSKGL